MSLDRRQLHCCADKRAAALYDTATSIKNHFLVKNLYIIVVAERGFGADSRECAATQHLCLRWAFALLGLVIVSGTEPFFVCALLVNGFVGRLLGKLRL